MPSQMDWFRAPLAESLLDICEETAPSSGSINNDNKRESSSSRVCAGGSSCTYLRRSRVYLEIVKYSYNVLPTDLFTARLSILLSKEMNLISISAQTQCFPRL